MTPDESEISKEARTYISDLAAAMRIRESEIDDNPAAARLRALLVHRARFAPHRDAPVREIAARVGDKWSSLLMFALDAGTFGHAMLRRVICAISVEKDISQRMLTLRLRALERDGMVVRKETPSVPPRVDYSLTPLGQEFMQHIKSLIAWIETHHDEIMANRRRFEESE